MNPVKPERQPHQLIDDLLRQAQDVQARLNEFVEPLQQWRDACETRPAALRLCESVNLKLSQAQQLLTEMIAHLRQMQMLSPPASTQRTEQPDHSRATPPAAPAKRILVVDDEQHVLELVSRVLKARGYHVETVSNGHEAIRRIEANFYDLIIADLKMPDIGGMDVYAHIEQHNPRQARRVVFSSGDVVSPHTLAFLERTGLPFLVKPFSVRELTGFVEKALASD
ncbi:MAG: response regulator [Acidobacteriota bacterium]|nr:response regulator [Blastocatellia bacterium]MDW8239769.1 response regulator [Acidobacteriota bacterium]